LRQRKQDVDARVKPGHDERIAFVTAPALQRTAPQGLRAALRPGHETITASCAGLTRASINLHRKHFSKRMDCRVKPGNDERYGACVNPMMERE
jgi:hypothetical protein